MISDQVKLILVILVTGTCYGQENDAEAQGLATIEVSVNKDTFTDLEQDWRYTMAWHASRHCKSGRDNCWTEDKQIRYHDVIIKSVSEKNNAVLVDFYMRDRYDHDKAALSGQQVRSFFLKYEADIVEDFHGKQMTFVLPEEEGMEAWLIAVIVICSVVGTALIIAVIVLAVKQHNYKKQKKNREELRNQLHNFDLTLDLSRSEGKGNPIYESDNDNPASSVTSGQSRGVYRVQSAASHGHTAIDADIRLTTDNADRRTSSSTMISDDDNKDKQGVAVIDFRKDNLDTDRL